MKLFRAIIRDTVRNTIQQTVELFESEDQVAEWLQNQRTFHETWEDYYEESRMNYVRTQFPLILVGIEEVNLWQTF